MGVMEDAHTPLFSAPYSSCDFQYIGGKTYGLHARVEVQPPRKAEPREPLTRPIVISLECSRFMHHKSFATIFLTDRQGKRITQGGSGPLGPRGKLNATFKVPQPDAQPWQHVTLSVIHPYFTIAYAVFNELEFRSVGVYRIGVAITQWNIVLDMQGIPTYSYINGRVATSPITVSEGNISSGIHGMRLFIIIIISPLN